MKRLVPARGWTKWLGGAALGAALLLLSGRQRGLRHLTALQDMKQMKAKEGQETEAGSHERVSGRSGSSGLRRLRMLRVRVAHMLRSGRQIDDVALEEKVHARLKAAASRPSAIQVSVRDGCIVLNGSVGAGEKRQLLDDVASVAGVLKVEDRMRVIENGDGAEPAAGDGRAAERRSNGAGVWGPAVQAASAVGGVMRRNPAGAALAVLGLGLIARSVSFRNDGQDERIEQDGTSVSAEIDVGAAPEAVFDLWSRHENFSRFVPGVTAVRDIGHGRMQWTLAVPGSAPIEWTAILDQYKRPLVMGWSGEPAAGMRHAGLVCFLAHGAATRVTVRISCTGLVPGAGHAALLLPPAAQLERELQGMKAYIEAQTAKPAALPHPRQFDRRRFH